MTKQRMKDPWLQLRRFTSARIALGRAGDSLPTDALLDFELAQARARDAVHEVLKADLLLERVKEAGFSALKVHSAASDRSEYLRRPDRGRMLDEPSKLQLQAMQADERPDVAFVIADGLSALAAERHAFPLLELMPAKLPGWNIGPVVVAEQARVALGDEIGGCLRAAFVVVLIGERPGMSSPDSLGIYLTAQPRSGRTDAERNCISNVRPEGLNYEMAAKKLAYLLMSARKLGTTGVLLKDHSDLLALEDEGLRAQRAIS